MLLRTLIAVLVLGLLLVACTTNKDSNDNTAADPSASETDTAADADSASDATERANEAASGDIDASGGIAGLLSSASPFGLLTGLGDSSVSQDIDPSLKRSLLDVGDLPSDFFLLGEFSGSAPSDLDKVSNAFTNGDADSDQFTMVMSSVIVLKPEVEDVPKNVDELRQWFAADLEALEAEDGELFDSDQIELLEAPDLGEGGLGVRVTDHYAAFGGPDYPPDATGNAMEVYVFFKGDQMLTVITIWPAGQSPRVDPQELAQRMADK